MSTITEHPNVATVRGFYAALGRGDVEEVTGLLSPDVTILMPGRSPLSGRYEGRDAVLGFLGELAAATGGTYRAELRGLYANDAQVVAVHHGTGRRAERELAADAALVFELSDGAVTAISVHQQRQDEWDEFFS